MNSAIETMLRTQLKKIKQLPTLPAVYYNLQKLLSDPDTSAKQIGSVIEKDQSLSSQILRIVNSAFYGFPRKISTISEGVVILGFREIHHLSLSISVIDLFKESNNANRLDHTLFWKHSLAVAICANIIARKAGVKKVENPEIAFVAGLLHDIGILILDQYLRDLFYTSFLFKKKKNLYYVDAEKEAIGFTHQEVGQFLTEYWNLPANLVLIPGHHHRPIAFKNSTSDFALLSIINLAEVLTHAVDLSPNCDTEVPRLFNECWNELGHSIKDIDSITRETLEAFDELSQILVS